MRKTSSMWIFLPFSILCLASSLVAQTPLGTAFTYQGHLNFKDQPAGGAFDFRFRLFDGSDPNSASLLGTQTSCNISVQEGLLTTDLDFGNVFDAGEELWLEISVFEAGDCTSFINLSPLQAIRPAPFAHYAPEDDPTVLPSVKDGVTWNEVGGIPAGLADGTDHTVGGETLDCYSTDWGDRSDCALNPPNIYPAPVPACAAGYVSVGLAEVGVAPTDCANWTGNVRLRVKARCCRIQ